MGTNFYLKKNPVDYMDPEVHIGKRSAAGSYCWECRRTLCIEGESKIHYGSPFSEVCLTCGSKPEKESIDSSSAGLELGFAKPRKPSERTGVKSVSSFTWAMDSVKLRGKRYVLDEYGRPYTMKRFREEVLDNCPIQFYTIGRYFS